MDNFSKLVATTDSDGKTAGAITYWRLAGAVSRAALAVAWEAAGLDVEVLPDEPSETVGLSRAIKALLTPSRKAVKVTGGDFKGGWVVSEVDTSTGEPVWHTVAKARTDEDGTLFVDVEPDYAFQDNQPTELILRRAYLRVCGELDAAGDISPFLKRQADALGAVSLREHGGVHFIPRTGTDDWDKIVTALSNATNSAHRVERIPALQTEEAVAAILTAVEDEAKATIEAFEAELCKEGDDALGKRAIRNRKVQAEALAAKLASYEALLGVKLSALHESLETTQANLTAAQWALEAEEDQAAAAG